MVKEPSEDFFAGKNSIICFSEQWSKANRLTEFNVEINSAQNFTAEFVHDYMFSL